jgi:hypothetical protein
MKKPIVTEQQTPEKPRETNKTESRRIIMNALKELKEKYGWNYKITGKQCLLIPPPEWMLDPSLPARNRKIVNGVPVELPSATVAQKSPRSGILRTERR